MIVKYYTARFQQEFLFRDAKQFTGLNQCQSRSEHKIDFHWNMALSAVNFTKVSTRTNLMQLLNLGAKDAEYKGVIIFVRVVTAHSITEKRREKTISMASGKTRLANELILKRFIAILPPESEFKINHPRVRELCHWGCIAA